MSDDNMIPSDVWDELDAWDKSQESDRRREYELKSRIESGDVEEPGIGDYDAYPQLDEADAELSALSTKSSDDDCNWVTMRGTPVCIGDDNEIEIGPDGIDAPIKDDVSQSRSIWHNLLSNPVKDDLIGIAEYAKEVATLEFGEHSLIRRMVNELTKDPTGDDRSEFVDIVKENITLKPVRDFVMGRNKKKNPAWDDFEDVTAVVKKVTDLTVGNLMRLLWRGYKASKGTGEALPAGVLPRVMSRPTYVRSMSEPVTDDFDAAVAMITQEVAKRTEKTPDLKKLQNTILDVIEEFLAGKLNQDNKRSVDDKSLPFDSIG
jgi:hypothetical protein